MNFIDDEIIIKYELKYNRLFKDIFSFNDIYAVIENDLKRLCYVSEKELEIKNIRNNINKTKKRWIKKIFDDKNSCLYKEFEAANLLYEKLAENDERDRIFYSTFKFGSPDEYINNKKKCLMNWVNDNNSLLTDFEYLNKFTKRKNVISSAFKNDISLEYLTKSFRKEENDKNSNLTTVPLIIDVPVDTTSKIDLFDDEQKKLLDTLERSSFCSIKREIEFDEEDYENKFLTLKGEKYLELIESGYNPKDIATELALFKSIKYLNTLDITIFHYFYNHFKNMVLGTSIEKTIYQIVQDLQMDNGTKSYNSVVKSLAKLGSLDLSFNIDGNSLNASLLECFISQDEDTGAKRVEVFLGGFLQKYFFKIKTFECDRYIYASLSKRSKVLAEWFQRRRYKLGLDSKYTVYEEDILLGMFSTAILWNTKRKDRQRDMIIESLNELKSKSLVIEDFFYDKKLYMFHIKYLPLSCKEIEQLEYDPSSPNNKFINKKNIILEAKTNDEFK